MVPLVLLRQLHSKMEFVVFKRMLFAFSLFFSATLNADIYRWVDDQGRTHFGDRPSPQVASQKLQTESASGEAGASTQERQQRIKTFIEQKQRERERQQAARAKAEQSEAKQIKYCKKLRSRLKYMESISTFYDLNEQGERVFVSEAENTKIRERFAAKVRAACGA
jgi:hypothetical protein